MKSIEIKTVTTRKDLSAFVDFRSDLYKDSPTAVPYLYMDEMNALTKGKNPSLEFCDLECYLAYDENGRVVGRIAAIINNRANETWKRKYVRFGYYDFVDDINVSKALMEKVKEYGRQHGMEHIIGPMGFTDMDREGMLIGGFEHVASLHGNHNYEYYRTHMEQMPEFVKDNDWVQLNMVLPDRIPEKYSRVAEMVSKRYNLRTYNPTRHELVSGGLGKEIFEVLNECYAHLYSYSRLDEAQVDDIIDNYIKLADMNLISLIADDNMDGKLVGFGICFPSLSKAMRKTRKGRLFPFGWFHLLKALKWPDKDTVDMMLIGVLPEYRKKGANALIFNHLNQTFIDYGFKEALTLPMMETNNAVLGQWEYYNPTEEMRLRSYKASL